MEEGAYNLLAGFLNESFTPHRDEYIAAGLAVYDQAIFPGEVPKLII